MDTHTTSARQRLIRFVPLESDTLTTLLEVRAVRGDVLIGHIRWHPTWRKYAFRALNDLDAGASSGRYYSLRALQAISRKLKRLLDAYTEAHPNARRGLPPIPKPTHYPTRGRPPKRPPEDITELPKDAP
jgi:hypothetical protein